MVRSLRSQLNDCQVAFIKGVIHYPKIQEIISEEHQDSEMQEAKKTIDSISNVPSLELIPLHEQSISPSLLLGDLKLAEFRKLLQQQGFETEFFQGVLILPLHGLLVRKEATGKLKLEGKLSQSYFKVRQLLYSQHVMI